MSDATNSMPARSVLASFSDYAGAQSAVDRLSDSGFPVERVAIIGHDVRIEEQVTGRMTNGRAAAYGAATGAWFGLLIGLLFGFLTPGPVWLTILFIGLVLGAVWGAVFGFLAHFATRGRRDFQSVQKLAAERWDVTVDAELLLRAQTLLAAAPSPATQASNPPAGASAPPATPS